MRFHLRKAACLGLALATLGAPAGLRGQARPGGQVSTAQRRTLPGWWPTKGDASRADYVGPRACAECHASEATSQKQTAMARAALPASESPILAAPKPLRTEIGAFTYRIVREGNRRIYSVSDGSHRISAPLLYAFGVGNVGQTYVFERNGSYFESHLSFFPEIGLDITIGHPRTLPRSLEEAFGRPMSAAESRLCFGCHATAAVAANRLDPRRMISGVTCEACHGPGARHVAAMKAGRLEHSLIFNPNQLSPQDSLDFCGACHRTGMDVKLLRTRGVQNVRFQPYRLEKSKCWAASGRITCLTCHDPHEPLAHGAAAYDQKCLACHPARSGAEPAEARPAPACPVRTRDCANCHMPRYRIPGVPYEFTDHQIRIVKLGEPFPS